MTEPIWLKRSALFAGLRLVFDRLGTDPGIPSEDVLNDHPQVGGCPAEVTHDDSRLHRRRRYVAQSWERLRAVRKQ